MGSILISRLDRLVYNDSVFNAGHSDAGEIPVIADFTTAMACTGAWNETASRFRERARRSPLASRRSLFIPRKALEIPYARNSSRRAERNGQASGAACDDRAR